MKIQERFRGQLWRWFYVNAVARLADRESVLTLWHCCIWSTITTKFLSLVPAYPKIKLGGNHHSATRVPWLSHVSFCHSTPLVAGPHLNRKREHDHVRGTTDGRHKPDRWDTVIDKFTPKEFLDPIGTNASIWAPFFAEVQQHRASKAAAGELSSDSDSDSDSEHSADWLWLLILQTKVSRSVDN